MVASAFRLPPTSALEFNAAINPLESRRHFAAADIGTIALNHAGRKTLKSPLPCEAPGGFALDGTRNCA